MVNMGEIFAYDRIHDVDMELVLVSENEKHYFLEEGDLLFARQSLVFSGAGKCSIFMGESTPTTFEGHIIRVRIDENLADPLYYFYYFNSTNGRCSIETIVEQVSAVGIRGSDLSNLMVQYPPLETQKEIANILRTLDDKIELNRRMNKTLEEIAQTLFKHWFIDFEFPNAEGKPYKSSGGEMVDSELGLVPKGWRVGKLEELGRIVTGKTPSTIIDSYYGSDIQFITIPDMHNSTYVTKTQKMLSKAGADSQKAQYIPKESLCVSCIATLGLVSLTSELSQTNQQINSIIPYRPDNCYFTYVSARNLSQFIKGSGSRGSVFSNLNKGIFSKIQIVMPKNELVERYCKLVKKMFELIYTNLNENEQTEKQKTLLLIAIIGR